MNRLFLFLLTNIAVVATFGFFLNIVLPGLGISTSGTTSLLIFCALFGMGGSFISLLMSKKMALLSVRGTVIKQPKTEAEHWLLNTVSRLSRQADMPMPDVAIYNANDINAFATGASKQNALIAVSSGLMTHMNQNEREAVLAHEISHIANGDMVTMALIQGVLNTFVMVLARIVAGIISNALRSNNGQGGGLGFIAHYAVIFVAEIIFGILASIVAMWFSRQREYRADAGAGNLVGNQKMIEALQRLKHSQGSELDGQLLAFGINGKPSSLFASHPSLDDRIARLKSSF